MLNTLLILPRTLKSTLQFFGVTSGSVYGATTCKVVFEGFKNSNVVNNDAFF